MKEEPVDILDSQGNKTGETILKSEAHDRGLWHGAAHLWIFNSKGELLLQLRSSKKVVRPNIWDVSAAGHIAAGKEALETAVEEAGEELGLRVDAKDLTPIGTFTTDELHPDGWYHRVFIWAYATRADIDLDELSLEEDETSEVKWISIEKLIKDLHSPDKANLFARTRTSYELAIEKVPILLKK